MRRPAVTFSSRRAYSLGGVVFAAGLVCLYSSTDVMELDKLIRLDRTYALLPAVCLSFAGLVKSAQLPFSSWLTGARVILGMCKVGGVRRDMASGVQHQSSA